jgi:phosphatidylserine/phosphatidylglycerophosphate/cardiolipin synthase-like enzyme
VPRRPNPNKVVLGAALLLANVGVLLYHAISTHSPATPTLASASASPSPAPVPQSLAPALLSVHFSPKGGCTEATVAEIDAAAKSIHVQAYSFTSAKIADAIVRAAERHVEVVLILDKSQKSERYSSLTFFTNHHLAIRVDSAHAIAHNKIMLIDGRTVITGSFNFTKAAENENAENLLVIHDAPSLYAQYERNFQHHLDHSPTYTPSPEP